MTSLTGLMEWLAPKCDWEPINARLIELIARDIDQTDTPDELQELLALQAFAAVYVGHATEHARLVSLLEVARSLRELWSIFCLSYRRRAMVRHYRMLCSCAAAKLGRIQQEDLNSLPEEILKMAHAEYARQGHGQSFERIQERGGFSAREVIALLADTVERGLDICLASHGFGEAIEALRRAGLSTWDAVDDPEALIREMREGPD